MYHQVHAVYMLHFLLGLDRTESS